MRVLVAEDDDLIRGGLVEILQEEGYEVLEARDGAQALEIAEREAPDFVCLDIMMPTVSGYEVCRRLRARDERLPIIFITAKSEEIDKVLGLELGADDFIVKPFGVREVVARIRSVSRRCLAQSPSTSTDSPYWLGDIEVRPRELRAMRDDTAIELSLRDVRILQAFCEHPGQVLTRDALSRAGWGTPYLATSRSLDQHISQLRKRIERDPKKPAIIKTVHGAGYRYEP